ncbi:MAG: hypothetical protein AB7O44_05265 [Hyphomicrobiaceae bacterium]
MMFRVGLMAVFIAVAATSSWATMQALNYLEEPRGSSIRIIEPGGAIVVTEATYGLNCKDHPVVPPHENRARAGNATPAVARACDRKTGTCQFAVDVARLGDPVGGCSKDFLVAWRCGATGITKQASLAAEAHGRTVSISCPR